MKIVEQSGNSSFAVEAICLRHARFDALQLPGEADGQRETKARISNETTALDDDQHQVILTVNLTQMEGETRVFECEVAYVGMFRMRGVSDEEEAELLMTRCLDMLYPYISTTVAQLAAQAGFQGLQLVPLSFGALYRNEQREKQQWENIQDKVVRH